MARFEIKGEYRKCTVDRHQPEVKCQLIGCGKKGRKSQTAHDLRSYRGTRVSIDLNLHRYIYLSTYLGRDVVCAVGPLPLHFADNDTAPPRDSRPSMNQQLSASQSSLQSCIILRISTRRTAETTHRASVVARQARELSSSFINLWPC